MPSRSQQALLAAVLADMALIVGYIVSTLWPNRRVWPIGDSSWRWGFNWSALSIVFAAFPVLAYLDRDTFRFSSRRSRITGGVIALLGIGLSLSALFDLGWMESSGREGELRTDGIYRYTRNPQSLGFIPFIAGFIVWANSRKLAVHGVLTMLVYVLFPFAEEPWLREQYGDAYEAYAARTPRFIGWSSVKRFLGS
jgi:protein-S-isoprenylcysteine O-methyltransferase Ste14